MVKKSKARQQRKKGSKPKRRMRERSHGAMLDAAARAHCRLLRDPCGAPLCPSVCGGSTGYVQRFTGIADVFTAAGETAGVVAWQPASNSIWAAGGATGASALTVAWNSAIGPGNAFLAANARAARVVAACITVYSNASESARSGFIGIANTPASAISQGDVATALRFQSICPQTVRTPADKLEVRWAPSGADEAYTLVNGNFTTPNTADSNVIMIAATGLPAASGLRIKYTFVVEWQTKENVGIVSNGAAADNSMNTIDQVRTALVQQDPNWWYDTGATALKVVANVGAAVKGAYDMGKWMYGAAEAGLPLLTL